jgi:sialate O-acetylesterase
VNELSGGEQQRIALARSLVREALRTLPERVPNTAVTSAVDLPLVDLIHMNTASLIRLGRRMAKLALAGKQLGPQVTSIERFKSPAGLCNAIRVRFSGVTGQWQHTDNLRGFEVRVPEANYRMPLYVVNAWVDTPNGTDVIVVLNREMDSDTQLGYGLGLNPACEMTDAADMSLCSFLPRPVK